MNRSAGHSDIEELRDAYQTRLQSAEGYLALGLWQQARAELRHIDLCWQGSTQVLAVRLAIAKTGEKWWVAEKLARELVQREPRRADWAMCLAELVRRRKSPRAAGRILAAAAFYLWDNPEVHYRVARYYAQSGLVYGAKEHLKIAFRAQPTLRLAALDEPDLKPVWSSL